MFHRIMQNHWCRFLAGNASVGLLVVGIPAAILLAITQTITGAWAILAILAMVHVSLVGLQVSRHGMWIPEKWLAAGFVVLPLVDVWQTVRLFSRNNYVEGFWATVLTVLASAMTVAIVNNKWRKWHAPKPVLVANPQGGEGHHHHHHADDPTTMVY
jgi:hypothetical protein